MNVKLSPVVVIETRHRLVEQLASFGGRPIPQSTREQIADWLIGGGHLAESYFAAAATADGIEDDS
jgi:hypothetical protein